MLLRRKTDILEELLASVPPKVSLITRPRRFGKTLTMSMLREFFDIQKDSRDIFDGLKPYLSPSDLESFDQMQNMMNMMSMMQEMQNMSDMGFDPMSMMGMFAQEEHTESQKEGETIDGLDEQSFT